MHICFNLSFRQNQQYVLLQMLPYIFTLSQSSSCRTRWHVAEITADALASSAVGPGTGFAQIIAYAPVVSAVGQGTGYANITFGAV